MSCFLKIGSTGDKVVELEKALARGGYYKGLIDGKYGPILERAVRSYQHAHKLVVDGCVGDITWGVLFPKKSKTDKAPDTVSKTKGPIQTILEVGLGAFTSISQFTRLIRGQGYAKYYNDRFDWKESATKISKGLPVNCTDGTQTLVGLAREMGYEAEYIHVKCRISGTGHVFMRIRGKEFKDWTIIDIAAIISKDSKMPIGKAWCQDGRQQVIGKWLIVDDGDARVQ